MKLKVNFELLGKSREIVFDTDTHEDKSTDRESCNEYYVDVPDTSYTVCVNVGKDDDGCLNICSGVWIDWYMDGSPFNCCDVDVDCKVEIIN